MPTFKPDKLKTNLRLTINRFKLLEKKKTEQAMKARKEIADYIKADRVERARIRVEHIIREDYLVEAMEVLETYCDLLLARFGLLQTMQYCEESLLEPVSTLIWASPRLSSDIEELQKVSMQLSAKFGKKFAEMAVTNQSEQVNAKVMHRLGFQTPPRHLVESYLKEIASNYKVDYEPDPAAFIDEDGVPPPINEKEFLPRPDDNPAPRGPPPPAGGGFPSYPQGPGAGGPAPYNPQGPAPYNPEGPRAGGPAPYNPDPVYPPQSLPPQYASQAAPLPYPTQPNAMPQPSGQDFNFPAVPSGNMPNASGGSSGGGDGDLDFDDLTKRFEKLKGKK